MLNEVLEALNNLLTFDNILLLIFGILIGFIGGSIPGISGTMLVVVLLPVSYVFDPIGAFLLLTSIYAVSVFSGSISAILFRTPGTPESAATVFDGFPMAQKGEAGKALGISIMSSAIGGVIGTIILIFLTPLLASWALGFSSPEYFSLAFLGLSVVAALSGNSITKGLIGVAFGLFIATIGIDPITGVDRFTFNNNFLRGGIDFIPVLIGLFAVSEVLKKVQENKQKQGKEKKVNSSLPGMKLLKRLSNVIGLSTLLGFFIGVLPGVGATTASMVSYSQASTFSRKRDKFGTGIPEGIAAPESANNAAAMGAMVPLLALGIPGSGTTAVLLGAFILHGIQPGPLMLEEQGGLVYTIFIGLLISNIIIIFISKYLIKGFSQILKLDYSVIGPLIIIFCVTGSYAVRNSIFDVIIMLLFGIVGYFMEKSKFPLAPVVLGLVLGPIAEEQFRRALRVSNGDFSIFFTRPMSLVLIALGLISFLLPIYQHYRKRSNNFN